MAMFRFGLFLLLAWAMSAGAQPRPEWGIEIGVPVHGPVVSLDYPAGCCPVSQSWTRHPIFGVTASLPVAPRFRIRLDATYQRIGIDDTAATLFHQTTVNSPLALAVGKEATVANRWRVPAHLQWQAQRHIRVGLGPEVSLVTGIRGSDEYRDTLGGYRSFTVDYFRSLDRQAIFGVGAAAEFPFRVGRIAIAPGLYYTRWTAKHYNANFALDEVSAGIGLRL
jgi:hypothetical protein